MSNISVRLQLRQLSVNSMMKTEQYLYPHHSNYSFLHLQSTLYMRSNILLRLSFSKSFRGHYKRKDSTEQDTQSQSVAFNSWIITTSVIIFSEIQAQQC